MDEGSISVEAALILPMILLIFAAYLIFTIDFFSLLAGSCNSALLEAAAEELYEPVEIHRLVNLILETGEEIYEKIK